MIHFVQLIRKRPAALTAAFFGLIDLILLTWVASFLYSLIRHPIQPSRQSFKDSAVVEVKLDQPTVNRALERIKTYPFE